MESKTNNILTKAIKEKKIAKDYADYFTRKKTPKQIEVEYKIYSLVLQIRSIINEYCPEDDYLTVCIMDNVISFNNTYYDKRCKHKINFREGV